MQGSSQPLLRFEGVTIATRGSDSSRVLVSDVDLHVSAGEALGIVGEFWVGEKSYCLIGSRTSSFGRGAQLWTNFFRGKGADRAPGFSLAPAPGQAN